MNIEYKSNYQYLLEAIIFICLPCSKLCIVKIVYDHSPNILT